MAIAYLIPSVAEIEKGVSAALELSAALDRTLAILCLEAAAEPKRSGCSKHESKRPKEPVTNPREANNGANSPAFTNRVSYLEQVQAAVTEQCEAKGYGGARTEVFEIPVALAEIRGWLVRPPVTDKLGRFRIEMLIISFHRGAGTEDALDVKNQLFNLAPCEVVFLSAKDDLDWKSAFEAVACVGHSKPELRTARRHALEFEPSKLYQLDTEDTDAAHGTVIVGVRGKNTHIERDKAWNSLRRHDKVDLTLAINPADSFLERFHWQVDNRLRTTFAEYQMTREQREQLADELRKGTRSSPEFILFMSLATLLAAIGLLENSAAVVIGAMLVAPLMTPLLGAGLAMLQGNSPTFLTAIKATMFGIFIAFMIGMTLGFVASVIPVAMFSGSELKLTEEMISRSHPNLLDPFIGLAAGLAGGFAIGRDKKIGALAGVAIAAALVPPIATAGLEVSMVILCAIHHQSLGTIWDLLTQNPTELLAASSLLTQDHGDMHNVRLVFSPLALFVLNACAVILGTYVGLRLVGMHRTMYPKKSRRWVSVATVALLIALVVLLSAIPIVAHFAR